MAIDKARSATIATAFIGAALLSTAFFRKVINFRWRGSIGGSTALAAVAAVGADSARQYLRLRHARGLANDRLESVRPYYGNQFSRPGPITEGRIATILLKQLDDNPSLEQHANIVVLLEMMKIYAWSASNGIKPDSPSQAFSGQLVGVMLEVGKPNPFAPGDHRLVERFLACGGPAAESEREDEAWIDFGVRDHLAHVQYEGETGFQTITTRHLVQFLRQA